MLFRSPGDGGLRATAPMVRGAIQVTPSGEPVVLGPDHPTTGGYPVVGVVIAADQGRLAGATRVRFTGIGVDEARRERARWRAWVGR